MASWEEALTTVVSERGARLLRTAYLLCGDRSGAEDLVQDALVKTFARRRTTPRLRIDAAGTRDVVALGEAESYVRRAILTLYLDEARRSGRWRKVRHLVAAQEQTAGHESRVTGRVDVERALAVLAPRERACVILRFYDDLTVPQVARELGLAEGTVKRYLSDASATLAGQLDPGGADVRRRPARETGGSR
ncbi:RNA polymerase, sigma-24 subunit, ECF subfamily [Beutenbergia cavernae DSM 12333]|uniref:RNA polymerase, sigma-24 subunit, ECF subfamily n=1 Tax=Beutenbergia cavernae (strain ATCC BAA-8 / DSM 12333 / CCUG 43141 / JCM 11478 / NBRC 16432 / NCIMB 13614 / HKI 0122) TaxID=471853 RepID=C5BY01_BEUC1|nr:sigma-70 family RNA polymerase sigma factor [Beutenbergia cavernae]ACQ78895.1 RNA polymerase, sigma-24 subunit, ECF subfamily [Beutenbergia cavernae DSM 12333]